MGFARRIGGNKHRGRSSCRSVFVQNAEPACNLLVSLKNTPEIATETILVKLVGSLHVPQTAAIRADFVGQDDPHLIVFPMTPELHLEVHEPDADAEKQ